jgi:hypothetical protein
MERTMNRVICWLTGATLVGFVSPAMGQTQLLELEKSDATKVLQVDEDGGFGVRGTFSVGSIPITGAGVRLMWYPGKAAFRAGYVAGVQWDDGSIGDYSVALGHSTTASGGYSFASGNETVASGLRATAMGYQSTAGNASSVALGYQADAGGYGAIAIGYQATASGDFGAIAMGSGTTASGIVSTAMGYQTQATGEHAASMGRGTTAQAQASLVLGRYNVIEGSMDTWVEDDPVLVVGNGTDDANRSNALTLRKNGNLELLGFLVLESHEKELVTAIPAEDRKYEEMSCDNDEIVLSAGWNMPDDVSVIRSRRKSGEPWGWEFAMSNSSTLGTSGRLYITCVRMELQ